MTPIRRAARRLALLAGGLAGVLAARPTPAEPLWRLVDGRVTPGTQAAADLDRPHPVGSLQKPFVLRAWAETHAGEGPPHVVCGPTSRCWLAEGHGPLDLRRAVAVSCNTYFLELASHTSPTAIEAALRAAGFAVLPPVTLRTAIGLDSESHVVTIRPSVLLLAYDRLVREPWAFGEEVRTELLAGLRDAGLEGTALGLAQRGLYAKTGTVASIEGRTPGTSGWALAVDGAGWGALALVPRGTGRGAALALAGPLAQERPWSATPRATSRTTTDRRTDTPPSPSPGARTARAAPPPPERVQVLLLQNLHPRALRLTNADRTPLATSRGWLGPGASLDLRPADRLSQGLWRLELEAPRLVRAFSAALECRAARGGVLRLVADVPLREYVAGVIAAERPDGDPAARVELGAAVLRFLAQGRRHRTADVCDTTHCAWFVGHGPRVRWLEPQRALTLPDPTPDTPAVMLSEQEWRLIRAAAREPGPSQWTSHCGGAPLSAHAVWGHGDRRLTPCARHPHPSARWRRVWSDADLTRVFGARVAGLALEWPDGVWTLRVRFEALAADRLLRYDDAHRTLATVFGWAGLPSPADHVDRMPQGFVVTGVGLGHRVGVCLGDAPPTL